MYVMYMINSSIASIGYSQNRNCLDLEILDIHDSSIFLKVNATLLYTGIPTENTCYIYNNL